MPGMGELLIILVIVLLIFGAGKLPAIGESLGKSIRNFKRATNADDEIEVSKKKELGGAKAKQLEDADVEDADVVGKRAKKEA
jgi:sec-independent protein translocase protein TatA